MGQHYLSGPVDGGRVGRVLFVDHSEDADLSSAFCARESSLFYYDFYAEDVRTNN